MYPCNHVHLVSPIIQPCVPRSLFSHRGYRVDVYRSESGGMVCVTVGNRVTQLLLQLLLRKSGSVLVVLPSHLFQLNFDCIWYTLLFGAPTCGEGISIAPLLARPQSGADNVCQLLIYAAHQSGSLL